MNHWDTILDEAERLAMQLHRLEVDLAEAEKAGDYYVIQGYDDTAMSRYLKLMAERPPLRSRRSQRHFRNLWTIWRGWQTTLQGQDKARAWGWGVRMAKIRRGRG